jgi:hypothetical protein
VLVVVVLVEGSRFRPRLRAWPACVAIAEAFVAVAKVLLPLLALLPTAVAVTAPVVEAVAGGGALGTFSLTEGCGSLTGGTDFRFFGWLTVTARTVGEDGPGEVAEVVVVSWSGVFHSAR